MTIDCDFSGPDINEEDGEVFMGFDMDKGEERLVMVGKKHLSEKDISGKTLGKWGLENIIDASIPSPGLLKITFVTFRRVEERAYSMEDEDSKVSFILLGNQSVSYTKMFLIISWDVFDRVYWRG